MEHPLLSRRHFLVATSAAGGVRRMVSSASIGAGMSTLSSASANSRAVA
jgi:hypothetical protein